MAQPDSNIEPPEHRLSVYFRTPGTPEGARSHAGVAEDTFDVCEGCRVTLMRNAWGYFFFVHGEDVWAGYFDDRSKAIRKARALAEAIS